MGRAVPAPPEGPSSEQHSPGLEGSRDTRVNSPDLVKKKPQDL